MNRKVKPDSASAVFMKFALGFVAVNILISMISPAKKMTEEELAMR